jgi:hypothetical protein
MEPWDARALVNNPPSWSGCKVPRMIVDFVSIQRTMRRISQGGVDTYLTETRWRDRLNARGPAAHIFPGAYRHCISSSTILCIVHRGQCDASPRTCADRRGSRWERHGPAAACQKAHGRQRACMRRRARGIYQCNLVRLPVTLWHYCGAKLHREILSWLPGLRGNGTRQVCNSRHFAIGPSRYVCIMIFALCCIGSGAGTWHRLIGYERRAFRVPCSGPGTSSAKKCAMMQRAKTAKDSFYLYSH